MRLELILEDLSRLCVKVRKSNELKLKLFLYLLWVSGKVLECLEEHSCTERLWESKVAWWDSRDWDWLTFEFISFVQSVVDCSIQEIDILLRRLLRAPFRSNSVNDVLALQLTRACHYASTSHNWTVFLHVFTWLFLDSWTTFYRDCLSNSSTMEEGFVCCIGDCIRVLFSNVDSYYLNSQRLTNKPGVFLLIIHFGINLNCFEELIQWVLLFLLFFSCVKFWFNQVLLWLFTAIFGGLNFSSFVWFSLEKISKIWLFSFNFMLWCFSLSASSLKAQLLFLKGFLFCYFLVWLLLIKLRYWLIVLLWRSWFFLWL